MDIRSFLLGADSSVRVDATTVRAWMRDDSVEVRGATYQLLTGDACRRVDGELLAEEVFAFAFDYLESCLQRDQRGEWAHSRYEAAWELASWLKRLADEPGAEGQFQQLKEHLAGSVRHGNDVLRRVIVGGVLEHAFESEQCAKRFADWAEDDGLRVSYAEALEWSRGLSRKEGPG